MNPASFAASVNGRLGGLVLMADLVPARAQTTLDKVSFGTNWVPEAEHGGFFQALADGTYKSYGLDVTIVPGGPNDNNRMLLIAGKIDFFMSREHPDVVRCGRQQRAGGDGRRHLPEGSAGLR